MNNPLKIKNVFKQYGNKRQLILGLACLVAVSFAGCQTVEGFGKDVQSAGESIERAAD